MTADQRNRWISLKDVSHDVQKGAMEAISFMGISTEEDLQSLALLNDDQILDLLAIADIMKRGDELEVRITKGTVENGFIKRDKMLRVAAWVKFGHLYRVKQGPEYSDKLRQFSTGGLSGS